jgi:acyl-CoA synthetase (AMP-forming)/AMP-acid ligase II
MKTLGDAGITGAASAGLPGESVIAEGRPAPEVDLDQATDIAVLPFLHIYGMNSLLNASLLHRMHLVTMPALDLVKFPEVIGRYRVDLTCIVPPIAVALAKHPVVAEYGLTGMKHMVSGAAAFDGELADAVSHRIDSTVVRATA